MPPMISVAPFATSPNVASSIGRPCTEWPIVVRWIDAESFGIYLNSTGRVEASVRVVGPDGRVDGALRSRSSASPWPGDTDGGAVDDCGDEQAAKRPTIAKTNRL